MAFKPLPGDVFELQLPVRGKTYTIPSPDVRTGLMCQRLMAGAATVALGGEMNEQQAEQILSDDDERDLYARLLGPAWDQMIADGVPWHVLQLAGTTALLWVVNGSGAAEEFWNSGAPDEDAPKPAQKPAKKASGGK